MLITSRHTVWKSRWVERWLWLQ